MKPKTISVMSITCLNFEEISQMGDPGVTNHLLQACQLSRTRIIPKKVQYESPRVSRGQERITIHLLYEGRDTARVSFVTVSPINVVK
jgi:hypothetical protein